MSQANKKEKDKNSYVMLLIFLILCLVIVPGLILITFVAFLPTVAAWISNTSPGYTLPFCVGICNLATAFPCYISLIQSRFSMAAVYHTLYDPFSLLLILGGAGIGWAIYLMIPGFTVSYYKSYDKNTRQRLIKRYQQIKEIWGEEIPELSSISNFKETSSSLSRD